MAPKNKTKLTREEILKRKRETERLRYERIKNNPQKWEELKEKERQKYQRKKETGKRKLVKNMSPREHRIAKKNWKKYCETYRSKKKTLREVTNTFIRENTPLSEIEMIEEPQRRQEAPTAKKISENTKRARRRRKKILKKKNQTIEDLRKKYEKYKKRYLRVIKLKQENKVETPKTKLQKMLDENTPTSRKDLVKKALLGEVINAQLKENYSTMKTHREKNVFTKVISGPLVEKYKLWRTSNGVLTYKRVRRTKVFPQLEMPRPTRKDKISKECITTVRHFYQDDSNSRLGAGKKEFITRKGVKRQKRYLLDSLKGLYKKFINGASFKLSYQSFCRLRPFWVVRPRVDDRDTCLCITHANIDLKLSTLYGAKIISYNSHQKLLSDLCCDRYNEECLSRQCQSCVNRIPAYKEFDNGKPLHCKKWIAEKQKFIDPKDKKARQVTKYLKKSFIIQPRQLIEELHCDLDKFFCHARNIVHQFNAIKNLKNTLSDVEALIHMDFSENYSTKYGEEIQAFHFGGSRLQISLHTVVVYLKNSVKSYCTASTNTSHSPAAIWAHLQPVFKTLPSQIKSLHFLSDGPVTQYRNKTMFYILASKIPKRFPNLQNFSWNFSESGHGKGAPDGVGATCKRMADSIVSAGGDVDDLETFVKAIQQNCPGITLSTIDNEAIQIVTEEIERESSQLKTFNGTLRVHQVTGTVFDMNTCPVTLKMRSLSCFCSSNMCEHFKLGVLRYGGKSKLTVEQVYTDSECENEAGPSSVSSTLTQYHSGDYVLVEFPLRKINYRYVGVVDKIDDEGELTITFLKLCDSRGETFRVDPHDVSDVTFEQIIERLPTPNLVKKGDRIFYKFNSPINVFEK